MSKKTSLAIAVIICALVMGGAVAMRTVNAASAAEDGKYVWNVAMNVSESTLNYKFYAEFKKNIEAASNSSITVNLYPNGQLGGDSEQLLGLMDGTVDFSTTITSGLTSTIPEYGLFDLPNAFASLEMMRLVEDDEALLNALNEASAAKGIYLMGIADAGFRELSTNVEAHSAADFRGIKIRVIDNPYHQTYWDALGCASTSMDFNEVYASLQQKVIDAQENPYMNICANNFYEVQDYIIETNHLGHIMVFTMNYDLYNSLPADIQALVDECAAQALAATRAAADAEIENYKATILASGTSIIELDEAALAELRERAEPVYNMVRADLGDELVDIFMNACAAAAQ